MIGKGSFKTVYRGAWNNTHVAVVAMRRGGLVAEARLLQRLSTHPNLVQLYRWSADESGNEYLVMELLPLGSLDAVLRSIGRQLLTQTKMTVVEQLASACLELAHEGLVHGDLAARNLLVKSLEPPHVKLAGEAKANGHGQRRGGCEGRGSFTGTGNVQERHTSLSPSVCACDACRCRLWLVSSGGVAGAWVRRRARFNRCPSGGNPAICCAGECQAAKISAVMI